jgi:predicted N-acetyltransferase YhbS
MSPQPCAHIPETTLVVRAARAIDRAAMREVVTSAFSPYAAELPSAVFRSYLTDLLDLDGHARHGDLLVAEVDGRILGSGAFYRDIAGQGMGWPRGWAGGRGLAVHPDARGHGVARALLAECERRARRHGAPVFAFHTAAFMTGAIALYDRLGYRREPRYDFDLGAHFGIDGRPIAALAYRRHLTDRSL